MCNYSRKDVCGGRGEINRIRVSVLKGPSRVSVGSYSL